MSCFIGSRAVDGPGVQGGAAVSDTADSHKEERFHRIDKPSRDRTANDAKYANRNRQTGIQTRVRSGVRVFRVVGGTSCGISSHFLTRFSQFLEWFAGLRSQQRVNAFPPVLCRRTEPPEVAHALKARRQHEKATQELFTVSSAARRGSIRRRPPGHESAE